VINEAEIKRHIKNRAFAQCYIVCGGESYLKQYYAQKLCEAAVDEPMRDFNFHRFAGKTLTMDTLANAVDTIPLGSERSAVLVQDYPLESAKDDAALLDLLRQLPEHVVLVFWMDGMDFAPSKAKAVADAVQKNGFVAQFNPPGEMELRQLVGAGIKRRGCAMDRAAVDYFLETVGHDMNNLQNEMDKLCAFAAGEITKAHIDAVCVKTLDARSFDMVKAVASGDTAKALLLLDELFRQKIAPQMLMGSLIANYVDLFRAAVARGSGKKAETLADVFDYKGKTFRLTNAERMLTKYTMPRVLCCLDHLDRADRLLKSTAIDPRLVIEECLIALIDTAKAA
jgi:DNA polymerase-3 subunit delta